MNTNSYDPDDCIAALASPWAQSALAVIRTSGKGSIEKISKIFSRPDSLLQGSGNFLAYGYLKHPENGQTLDQVVAAVYKGPKSYTGQDSVELFLHGSLPGIKWTLDALRKIGFRDASPGEFTFRGFLNKKMDLTRSEAVHEIVTAKTLRAQNLALHRLSGGIEERINTVKQGLHEILAEVELQLDYPDDEIDVSELTAFISSLNDFRAKLKTLAETFEIGRVYQQGIKAAIAGRTNAGKSSLFNLFLREDRSIVSDIHGTTRDYIESWITVRGVPISLFDTAGLRDSDHPIEAEGIRRSSAVIESADIVLYLVDSTLGVQPDDREFFEKNKDRIRCIKIWNKIDIQGKSCPKDFFPLSSTKGTGLKAIEKEIERLALGSGTSEDDVVIDSERQRDLLLQSALGISAAVKGIEEGMPGDAVAVDLKEALDALGEITGEVTSADILTTMFSRFCVGK